MISNSALKKISGVALLTVFLLNQAPQAYAWGRGNPRIRPEDPNRGYYTPNYSPHGRAVRDLPDGYMRTIIGGLEYFYWQGMFYRMMEDRYVVVPAPVGAVVTTIPQGSQPVIVDGIPYYNINGVTYMYTPEGYQVVPQPKTIIVKKYIVEKEDSAKTVNVKGTTTAVSDSDEAFTINIPNSKGSYTAVTLKRSGAGFVGPQGEYYAEFPRVKQLKVMYAK